MFPAQYVAAAINADRLRAAEAARRAALSTASERPTRRRRMRTLRRQVVRVAFSALR